jgi:iron complex outermembrane recepter protein
MGTTGGFIVRSAISGLLFHSFIATASARFGGQDPSTGLSAIGRDLPSFVSPGDTIPNPGDTISFPVDTIPFPVDTIPVNEVVDLPEVMVSAFNVYRRLLDVPGSVSMIPGDRIEQENPVTVLPLFNQASGVFAHAGTFNTSRITIRGIGARVPYATGKIRAYFNQIPLTNGSGVSILEHIDPSVIERMEITKGPASSAYGAGLGGTVNITARQPAARQPGIGVGTEAGSFGLMRNSLVADMGRERLASSLVYSRTRSDGFRENNRYSRDALTSVTSLDLGDRTSFTALLAWSDMKGEIPSSIDSLTFYTSPVSAAQNWLRTRGYEDTRKLLAGVSGRHWFYDHLALDFSLFSTLHHEKEMRPFDVLYEDRNSAGGRLKASHYIRADRALLEIMGGGELFLEDFHYHTHENIGGEGLQGMQISENREGIRAFNLFLQTDMEAGRLNLSGGLNLHSTRIDYRDLFRIGGVDRSAVYRYGAIFSPRISANFRYRPFQSVFITISHGFSPPSLSETLTPEGFVNMDIRPERSWNAEAGLRGNLWNHRVFYDLNAYSMRVRDLLVAERVGEDAWVGRNAGASIHHGLEMEGEVIILQKQNWSGGRSPQPPDSYEHGSGKAGVWGEPVRISLRPVLTISDFRFTDFIDMDADHSGNRLPGIPFFTGQLSVHAGLRGGMYVSGNIRHVGEMPMNDANSRYSEPYTLLGVIVGYRRVVGRWSMHIYLKSENLSDTHHASMILVNAPAFGNTPPRHYYPGLPRNHAGGVQLQYRF